MTHIDGTFTSGKNTIAMSKNAIHNFNLSIKNSADIKSSEHLTEAIIKELAKVSKEINQQKDIEQIWQEQKTLNAIANNSSTSIGEGATNTTAEKNDKQLVSVSNTSSVSEGNKANQTVSAGEGINSILKLVGNTSSVGETISISNASIGEGVADTTGGPIMSSAESASTTSPIQGAENNANTIMSQTYASVAAQQTLAVPQMLQAGIDEPSIEIIKAEIKKKLDHAIDINDTVAIDYWTNISESFNDKNISAKDFDGKPEHTLFTQMYAALKQANQVIMVQNFNWDIVREKMIKSIDANILKGKISSDSTARWKLIQKQLKDDKINVANLFERYNELFLLLKEVEGLEKFPSTITITTKTKIYPNLSADRFYAEIGEENVYVFLKKINNKELKGSDVNKGAVKIKNTDAIKFITGESLDFILDETLVTDGDFKKKDINWIVYNSQKKNDKGIIFINEGTSFSYNFDTPGKYKVEAYGKNPGSNSNKKETVKLAAFVEVEIIAQEITIVPPATIKTNFIRPFTEEQLFKVVLKNPEVKTLNPLKLYYQIAYTNADKVTTISDEQELDSTGIVKLALSNLGEYSIKVVSKDQYTLNQKYSIKTIKNFINSIEITENKAEKDIYLWSITNQKVIFKAQNFMIEPTPQEKQNLKWLVYDKNGKIYTPDRLPLQLENNDAGKQYLVKGESFTFPIPKIEGDFTIEAYSNVKQGSKSTSSKKIFVRHPQVTEAYWTYNDGNKKKTSGFAGELNHIKASIPGYVNQPVRIKFYLNDSKEVNYYNDTKTNSDGEINKILKFDANLQKHFGLKNGKNAKIRFELEGIQNGSAPYLFKENANAYKETSLNVTTSAKIADVYFKYDDSRVNLFTQVPYGEQVRGVIRTLNMVGKQVSLQVYKNEQDIKYTHKTIVNDEGVAAIDFTLDKKWHTINPLMGMMDMFYLRMEGVESKISLQNGLNAIVSKVIVQNKETVIEDQDIKTQEARIRAFLRMIRVGEGTTTIKGYEKIFGGSSFIADYKKTWEDHPGIVITAKGKDSKGREKLYYSSASGAYQVKKDIWNDWGKKFREFYDIKDFSPASQDKFALVILKHKRGKDVIRLIRENKIEDAVKLCQGEWASLPDSPHGQPTVTWQTVMTEYNNFLKEELEGKSPLSIKSGFLKDLGYGDDQKKEIINDVVVKFTGSSANRADLSFKTINVLKEVASVSKNFEIKITSTKRASYDQARIMYENCESTGGRYQRDQVYGDVGDKIIEVYITEAEIGKKEKEFVIKKMEEKIIELGSENVSKHLGDYIFLETFDIQYSGLPNPRDFKKEFLKRKELDHILYEPKNNCYHIQINQ